MANVAALIADYKSTEQALVPLQSADTALAQAASNAQALQVQVGQLQAALGTNQAECTKLESRIHRNENPRFFHYFIFNRKARAERFRGELGVKRGIEAEQQKDLSERNEQLSGLRQVESEARGTADRKHQMEAHLVQLFDQVVASQPVTPQLQELQNKRAMQSNAIAAERGLQAALQQSEQLARRGVQEFEAARQTLQRAEQENRSAEFANFNERCAERREESAEWRGDGFGAMNAEFSAECAERRERMLQAMRDQHINQSCSQASAAYRSMHAALFSSFPQEARARYPQLCMQIGQTPFPQLEGASGFETSMADLFGPIGGMINENRTECKIMRNLAIVQQCERIAQQQHALIAAVCSAVGSGIAQMDQNLLQINSGIEMERKRIFGAVMSSCSQAPQMMQVTCPEGVVPGTQITTQAPGGQQVVVEVPMGVLPGQQFQVQL